MLLLLSTAVLAAPSATELKAVFDAQVPAMESASALPLPTLDVDQWEDLAKGKVVRYRLPVQGEIDGVVGIGFLPHPVEHIWVGAIDDVHNKLADGLTETWLPGTVPGHKVLYQHLDVPVPFSDRHWVVVVDSNQALFAASQGVVWERTWDLDARGTGALSDVPAGLVEEPEEAVWTPVNEGGWTLIPTTGGTLVIYQVRTNIGGNIPEELVVRFAMSSLDQMIDHLSELAERTPGHYVGEHFKILRPDGSDIPTR